MRTRAIPAVLLALILVLLSLPAFVQTGQPVAVSANALVLPAAQCTFAWVTYVIDGDTIEVDIDGATHRVRYIGVNTAEVGEPCYQEARDENRDLVEGRMLCLDRDVSGSDRYGRLLRYVYADGLMINSELLRRGVAQAATYPPDVRFAEYFAQLEQEARQAGTGCWSRQPTSTTTLPQALRVIVAALAWVIPIAAGYGWPLFAHARVESEYSGYQSDCLPFSRIGVLGILLGLVVGLGAPGFLGVTGSWPAYLMILGGALLLCVGMGSLAALHWDETAWGITMPGFAAVVHFAAGAHPSAIVGALLEIGALLALGEGAYFLILGARSSSRGYYGLGQSDLGRRAATWAGAILGLITLCGIIIGLWERWSG